MRRSHNAPGYGYAGGNQTYQPTYEMLEQENDQKEEQLSSKVKALKSLTIDIGTEVRDQNRMLLGMDTDFDSSTGLLEASMKKLKFITQMGGHRQILYLVLFCFFVFFICWIIVRSR
ncbi:BET1 homolog [Dreissena polymorpha]|uniref:t-SNARE coiled-coil homology domain-containing protein n=1 Tax=Dreissena polymorpha TaxID=45954 RepID=A0A9D4RSM4_DREPO|nr:BET1 homolog [Dreissena polymorpha]KAH3877230.1 hypothetical protein DPMN_001092 [Dreissena polymorpha]